MNARRPGTDRQLLRLMEEVSNAGSLPQLCRSALRCLRQTLGVERSSVLVFDSDDVMRFVAWEGLSDEYRQAVDGHTPWTPQDADATPILVPDVRRDSSLADLHDVFARERVASLAFIPLRFAGRVLGKFMLYYDEPHAYTDDEVQVARIVAGHLAFALEHQRVAGDLSRRLDAEHEARAQAEREVTLRRQLEQHKDLLVRAGQVLSLSLEQEQTLEALSELVVPAFADWYVVHLLDEQGLIVPTYVGHTDRAKVEALLARAETWPPRADSPAASAAAIHHGRSTLVETIAPEDLARAARDPDHHALIQELGFRSGIVVPLRVPEKSIGSMTFVQAQSGRTYTQRELAIAESLADQAALALDNARLYREARAARKKAEEAAHRLDVLAQGSAFIAASLAPDAALEQLARYVVSTLADYCIGYRLDGDGSIRRVGLAHADPKQQPLVEELGRLGALRSSDSYGAGAVLRTGEPILASEIPPELLHVAAQNDEHRDVLRKLSPRSSLIVPLNARGRTLGALALAATDRSGRRYGQADLALAQELAHSAALLVDNARLYADAQDATRARDDMIAIVSHDLRSPLHNVVTACELLEMDLPVEQRRQRLLSIRRAAKEMSRLLEDLLDVSRIEAGRLSVHVQPVDLRALVSELASMHGPVAEDREIRLDYEVAPDLGEIDGDRSRLGQALGNLLGNALKFTPRGGEVRMNVEPDPMGVRISVADNGPGIPPDDVAHLFDRFWRGDRENRDGVGLGLAIAKGIAEAHRGSIEVESTPGVGSRFALVLPRVNP